ncbi:MAG: non-homologous end-joining DNA ligase [Deltaproteobacteria bacterium]
MAAAMAMLSLTGTEPAKGDRVPRENQPRRDRERAPAAPALAAYEKRRSFSRSPEPAPRRGPPRADPIDGAFVIHKHDARRLHYDLRLEMGGALASWAVPKGPSFDPATKRLALETEDHPLDYGSFEGRIPEGEYGAGDSLVWDRGSYRSVPPGESLSQRAQGHLLVELHGEKLRGRWHLIRTGRAGEGPRRWLLFKARDEAADAAFDVVVARPESVVSGRVVTRGPEPKSVLRAPHPKPRALLAGLLPPMLATLVRRLPGAVGSRLEPKPAWRFEPKPAWRLEPKPGWRFEPKPAWRFEPKIDGFRALAAVSGGRVALVSRRGLDLGERFPEVAQALQALVVGEAVIDGEVAALGPHGAPRFELLQQAGAPVVYFAFDLLWLDGEPLRARPLEERRDLLISLLGNAPAPLRLCELFAGPAERALARARAEGQEGVVAKALGSSYVSGRSGAWLKYKLVLSQEAVIVGMTKSAAGRGEIGALLVAVAERGGFRYAGKVGTGFTARQRRELWEGLLPTVVDSPPVVSPPRIRGASWVEPAVVCQLRFGEWTRDGRLRHPSFLGLRPDQRPEACLRVLPVIGPS